MSLTTKRVCAYLFDVFLVYVFLSLLINVKFINPYYEKYNESYTKYSEVIEKYYNKEISFEEMQEQNADNFYYINKYSISTNIAVVVVLFLYFALFQKYNNGQTLGKKIMKIRVVSDDKKDISVLRYTLRLLPMYFIFIGNGILLIVNSVLVLTLSKGIYNTVGSILTYIILGLGILDVTMNIHNKISHTKVEVIDNN